MKIGEDLTYEGYIDTWEDRFGDDTQGEYGYWRGNRHFPYQVHRLSPDEFETHRQALVAASVEFEAALAADDDQKMEAALNASMPHELALLL